MDNDFIYVQIHYARANIIREVYRRSHRLCRTRGRTAGLMTKYKSQAIHVRVYISSGSLAPGFVLEPNCLVS